MAHYEVRVVDRSKNVHVEIEQADGEYRNSVRAVEAGRLAAATCFEADKSKVIVTVQGEGWIAPQWFHAGLNASYAPLPKEAFRVA